MIFFRCESVNAAGPRRRSCRSGVTLFGVKFSVIPTPENSGRSRKRREGNDQEIRRVTAREVFQHAGERMVARHKQIAHPSQIADNQARVCGLTSWQNEK